MSESPDKVVERIRKLLAMSKSANENEAGVAAAKAATLLAEYNLTIADVVGKGEHGFKIDDAPLYSDSRPWRRKLAPDVARTYFCDYVYSFYKKPMESRKAGYKRFDVHQFVGAPHNIMVAKSMFQYLCDTIDRLVLEASQSVAARGRVSFATSFRHGCADRISERLAMKYWDMKEPKAIAGGNKLPALIDQTKSQLDDFMKQAIPDLQVLDPQDAKLYSLEGAHAGRLAGDSVGLEQQLESGSVFTLDKPAV